MKKLMTPNWYRDPAEQVEMFRELNSVHRWGFEKSMIPSVPDRPVSLVDDELLMLNAIMRDARGNAPRRTLTSLWNALQPPRGWRKFRVLPHTEADPRELTNEVHMPTNGWLSANFHRSRLPGVRWVRIRPHGLDRAPGWSSVESLNASQGLRSFDRSAYRMAGTEVLMAAVLFPGWLPLMTMESIQIPLRGLTLDMDNKQYVPTLTVDAEERTVTLSTTLKAFMFGGHTPVVQDVI